MRQVVIVLAIMIICASVAYVSDKNYRVELRRERTNQSVVTPEQAMHIIDSVNKADSIKKLNQQ